MFRFLFSFVSRFNFNALILRNLDYTSRVVSSYSWTASAREE